MSYMDQQVSSSTHPSSKRDYGDQSDGSDEYEEIVPAKKQRDSPPMENFEQSMEQHNNTILKVFFPIPEHCVGLVIGRNGTEIQSISQKSSCRVQVATERSTTGYRMVEIDGSHENIEKAKILINDVVARGNARQMQPANPGNKITIEIPIPPSKCGSVIGKGGETMRKLRSWSNCQIQLIQDTNTVSGVAKPLRITGDPQAVEQAKALVADILASNDESPAAAHMIGNGPVATMSMQVKVPRSTVGAIMGLQGKNIRKLSEETGTKIQFLPDDDPKLMERSLAIIGNRNKVYIAAQMIKGIVDANNEASNAPISLFYMSIPASKCGLVIGRGGDTIKQINTESGAHCELSREANPNPNEKTFVIRGSELQVEHAKHLICMKVGDIPPNTPFNPYGLQQPQQTPQQPTAHAAQMWDGQPIIQGQPQPIPAQLQPQMQGQPVYQQPMDWQQVHNRQGQIGYAPGAIAGIPVTQQMFHHQGQPQPAIQGQFAPHYPQGNPVQPMAQQPVQHHLVPQQQHQHQQPQIQQQQVQLQQAQQQAQQSQPVQAVQQATEAQNANSKEGETDYSAQWLEYYISIGDTDAANGVRARITQMQEEKARKEASAAVRHQPDMKADHDARLVAANMDNERRYAMQMAQQQRPHDGYYQAAK